MVEVSPPRFGLFECDGSIAVIVSAIDAAEDCRHQPIRVEAVGTQIIERISWDQGTLTHEPQLMGPSAHLWTRTELTPTDVDVALLYAAPASTAWPGSRPWGFCGRGEGADFVARGERISLNGDLPLNPHGGQLSAGRTHGFGFVKEAVHQLRGQAGSRQVQDAKVAVTTTGGGTPGGVILLTTER